MSRAVANRVIERYGTGLAGVLLFAVFAATAPRFLERGWPGRARP